MGNLRGIVGGVLALVLLQTVATNTQAPGRVGDLLDNAAELFRRFADPTVPAFPAPGQKRKPLSAGATVTPASPAPAAAPAVFYPSPSQIPVSA